MTIGERIRELRLSKQNYTQIKLAKDAGLTPAAISQYESNVRKPNADALQKIAAALNVSADYLLGDDSINNEDNEKDKILLRSFSKLNQEDKKQVATFIDYLATKKKNEK
jgi:transcriptional regulator with XRE-family HTH domain